MPPLLPCWGGSPQTIAGLIRICNPYALHPDRQRYAGSSRPHPMPDWPHPDNRRSITIELPTEFVAHLDSQAQYIGCSRAAYLRQLVRRDMDRQGPAPAAA